MMEDPSDELMAGLWPFMKRALMLFLPLWVFLLLWAAGAPSLAASILAGLSLAPIVMYEKLKLKQRNMSDESRDRLNK